MGHVHYDLDKVERDIREMFAKNVGRSDGQPLDFINQQQDKSCEIVVAFTRWKLQMEMDGAKPEMMLRSIGVVLSDLAHHAWMEWDDIEVQGQAAQIILQAFCAHTNQCMARTRSGLPGDMETIINPVVSGRA